MASSSALYDSISSHRLSAALILFVSVILHSLPNLVFLSCWESGVTLKLFPRSQNTRNHSRFSAHKCRLTSYRWRSTLCNSVLHFRTLFLCKYISPWERHFKKDKNDISQDGRLQPANHFKVTNLKSGRQKMKTTSHQWRMTYCCQEAYRQSVAHYNMCVNDNVKGYCHASLLTQNTLPLWKLPDH